MPTPEEESKIFQIASDYRYLLYSGEIRDAEIKLEANLLGECFLFKDGILIHQCRSITAMFERISLHERQGVW